MRGRVAAAAVRRRLPGPVKEVLRWVAGAVDPLYVRMFRRGRPGTVSIPPRRLRHRIGSTTPADYVEKGGLVAERIVQITGDAGRPIGSFTRILDFGCGTGRVIDHLLPELNPDAEVWAVDVDSDSIAWAVRQGSRVNFETTGFDPPLRFEDESFDLIYAISIFTHLDERRQDLWLAELHRLLQPDGLALVTVLGPALYDRVRTTGDALGVTQAMVTTARGHDDLDTEGLVFLPYVRRGTAAQGSPDMGDEQYGLTFHGHSYLVERWGEHFEVVDRVPQSINVHQDAVVLVRRVRD